MDEKEKELLPEEQTNENMTNAEQTEEAAEGIEEIVNDTEQPEEAAEAAQEAEDTQETAEAEETAEVAEEPEAAADEADSEKSELEAELEEIKDMFQQELDKAAQKAEQGELIQELSEIEEEQNEEADENVRLCECCEENPASDEFGEDYPYCDSCREFMKHYPLRKSGIFVALVMFVVFCGTMVTSVLSIDETFISGFAYESEGRVMSSVESYYQYVNGAQGGTVSMRAVKGLIDGFYKTGYISDAAYLINEYFSETDLKMPWNYKYKNILEENSIFEATSGVVSDIVSPAVSGEEYDYEEIVASLEALKNETDEEGNKLYSNVFIDYYIYEMMRLEGKSVEQQLELLKKTDAENNNGEWVYLVPLCQTAAKAGDLELTKATFDRLIKINKENTDAYNAYATYYRFTETPDPEKIIEICGEAEKNASSSNISYKHNLAIAYLLKGEGALAMAEMDELMSAGSYSVSNCNLYALVALYNGNTEIYNSMKSTLEYYGYELSDLVEKYNEGEMEIADILKDKGGDI